MEEEDQNEKQTTNAVITFLTTTYLAHIKWLIVCLCYTLPSMPFKITYAVSKIKYVKLMNR